VKIYLIDMNKKAQNRLIGRRVADFRKRLHLTQTELGQKVGISQPVLASYETGRRSIPVGLLVPLAQALQVSTEDLLGAPGPGPQKPGPPSLLERKLREASKLSRAEQRMIAAMLDGVLAEKQ
jgi:transcriptional regulator with XRE-family HTH domain